MGDDARETTESKEAVDRAKVVRERREADRRRRLDELRAHAAAAEAQRERLNEERRKRLAEQRAKDENRWQQVEENKRALCEASVSRSESLRMRERLREERLERIERVRAARSSPRAEFAFGSSTPRLLEPHDSGFWAARRTASTSNVMFASAPLTRRASPLHYDSDVENRDEPERSPQPIMWSSVARRRTDLVPTVPSPRAPGRAYSMTRLDKIPSQRPLHHTSPSMHHLNRIQPRSGDTTPGSRPGSAMSSASAARRTTSFPHKARPASIAGTGVNTPRGGGDTGAQSAATTPSVSRDGTVMACGDVPRRAPTAPRRPRPASMHEQSKQGGASACDTGVKSVASTSSVTCDGTKTARGDVPRRAPNTPRRPRPSSMHVHSVQDTATNHSDVKPPLPRKPKKKFMGNTLKFLGFGAAKPRDEKSPGSPGRAVSPAPGTSEEPSGDRQVSKPIVNPVSDNNEVNAIEVTQALEALQIQNGEAQSSAHNQNVDNKINEIKENVEEPISKPKLVGENKPVEVQKPAEQKPAEPQKVAEEQKPEKPVALQKPAEREEEKNERSQERAEESEMTASMTAKRITTEEEAKAALAERRRKAREELEKHAELERQRLQREAEEEVERQRQEEERQRREEEEARELAQLQRQMEEDKLRTAIEAQQQRQREESERKAREEAERQARLKEEEEKRKAAEEAERLRREEAEREEKERLARKQRVEAIMRRTRLKKEEDKKQQENKAQPGAAAVAASPAAAPAPAPADNGNGVASADLLGLTTSQTEEKNVQEGSTPQSKNTAPEAVAGASTTATPNNGNVTANLLGLSEQKSIEDKPTEQMAAATNKQAVVDNSPNGNVSTTETNTNNGNFQHNLMEPTSNVGRISANFIQTERMSTKLIEDDFTAHNGHGDHNYTI